MCSVNRLCAATSCSPGSHHHLPGILWRNVSWLRFEFPRLRLRVRHLEAKPGVGRFSMPGLWRLPPAGSPWAREARGWVEGGASRDLRLGAPWWDRFTGRDEPEMTESCLELRFMCYVVQDTLESSRYLF